MAYLRAITSSVFALAFVSLSVPGAQADAWTQATVTDADTTLLLSAVGDVSTYSSGVATFLCVYKVNSLETQAGTAGDITDYNFGVTACNAGTEGGHGQQAGVSADIDEGFAAENTAHVSADIDGGFAAENTAHVSADIDGGFAAGNTAHIALRISCRPHTHRGDHERDRSE
ncbi:hypothetical protein ON010_g10158 [Phytophthora cinnamomi]|nr:hypothetical protein ON010_g10158 [Phytophthora cinnamomi]